MKEADAGEKADLGEDRLDPVDRKPIRVRSSMIWCTNADSAAEDLDSSGEDTDLGEEFDSDEELDYGLAAPPTDEPIGFFHRQDGLAYLLLPSLASSICH